jgi:short-subunit dehydrogenase
MGEQTDPHLKLSRSTLARRSMRLVAGVRNVLHAVFRRLRRGFRKPERNDLRVLITGATTGIGLALARHLIREGKHRLILTARTNSMERFAAENIHEAERVRLLPLDVTDSSERVHALHFCDETFGGLDVLVNNAGTSYRSVVEHVTEAERMLQLDINYMSPMALTRLFLPGMRARGFGKIINVSSVGGMMAMPTMATYSASKFALEGASEALWYEVKPFGIHVSLVRPGFLNSDGFQKVRFTEQGIQAMRDPSDPYHRHYFNMTELVEALMHLTFYGPNDVAETISDVIDARNPPLRVPGTLDAYLFDIARRLMPGRLYNRLLYASLPRIWEWGDLPPETKQMPASKELNRR